jgi:hypothetical protein
MPTTHISELTAAEAGELEATARAVLDDNWLGASTVPSRSLYPHQWSWDSAFVAIGRSWYDQQRAQTELETLFNAQWANGMLPHIVFNPAVPPDGYFPAPTSGRATAPAASRRVWRPRGSPSRRCMRPPRWRFTGMPPTLRRPWPFWSGCTPSWWPSMPTSRPGATRTGAGWPRSSILGSRAWTTRRPGTRYWTARGPAGRAAALPALRRAPRRPCRPPHRCRLRPLRLSRGDLP